MNDKEVLRKRWWAFLLGEAPPEDCNAIQAEIEQDPEEAALLRQVIGETTAWAKEPVPYTPLHLAFLDAEEGRDNRKSARPTRFPWRKWAMAATAAAVLAIVASQVRFSATVGTVTLQWRQEPVENKSLPDSTELLSLAARIRNLERISEMTAAQIQLLAAENTEIRRQFGAATVRLAYSQRADTEALSREIQGLLCQAGERVQQNGVPPSAQ